MARYYTIYTKRAKALDAARSKSATEGCSQTIFKPVGAKPGWYIVGPTADAPDLVASGCEAVFSVQTHPRHTAEPVVDWENEAKGLCNVISGLHVEVADLTEKLRGADAEVAAFNDRNRELALTLETTEDMWQNQYHTIKSLQAEKRAANERCDDLYRRLQDCLGRCL
jgi:alkanesulfonate monooxygenase SsuD/methylene tetrahydromethanopterin reductase-like flavin-dependent oxidoreductase (luciferase family)